MSELVKNFKKNSTIRYKALTLTQGLKQKDYTGEIRTIFQFVQNNIRYVRDINDVETLQWPTQTLDQESGDCDDKAILLASLLESIGHKTRFVALGFKPGEYSHVITDTVWGPGWLPLDPTEPRPMGWTPPGIIEAYVWKN